VALHQQGLVVLHDQRTWLTPAQVAKASDVVENQFNTTMTSIRQRDQVEVLEQRGFTGFKMRGRGRYDMTLNAADFAWMQNPPWIDAVRSCLGGVAHLQHAGCIISMPSSSEQVGDTRGVSIA
jgi:hypothetical protein